MDIMDAETGKWDWKADNTLYLAFLADGRELPTNAFNDDQARTEAQRLAKGVEVGYLGHLGTGRTLSPV